MKVVLVLWWLLIIRVILFRLHYNVRALAAKDLNNDAYQPLTGQHYLEIAKLLPQFQLSVTVQIVTYNEGELLAQCLNRCAKLKYPKDLLEIQVLDNSTDDSWVANAILCRDINEFVGYPLVTYIKRNNEGRKAGALKDGLAVAKGNYIAVLDVDFFVDEYWLCNMMQYFVYYSDGVMFARKLGMVQGRWKYRNKDKNVITRGADALMTSYFKIEKRGERQQGIPVIFNGSGAVWSKECILASGNWNPDTVVSMDVDLSNRVDTKHWDMVYADQDACATEGLVPETWSSFVVQQARWARGGSWFTIHQPYKFTAKYVTWTTIKLLQYILLVGCVFTSDPFLIFASLVAAIPNVLEVIYFKKVVGWRGYFAAVTVGVYSLVHEAMEVANSIWNKPDTFVKTPKSEKDVRESFSEDTAAYWYWASARFYIDLIFICCVFDLLHLSKLWFALPLVYLTVIRSAVRIGAKYA